MAERWLTQTELGEVTGLTRQTLAEWSRRAGCPKKKRGTSWVYAWPDWNEWRIDERIREAVAKSAPGDADEAKTRKLAAEAALAELELERARGLVVDVTEARQEVDAALDRLRSRLVSLPGKWGPLLVGCRTVSEATERLDGAVNEALADLSGAADDLEEAA